MNICNPSSGQFTSLHGLTMVKPVGTEKNLLIHCHLTLLCQLQVTHPAASADSGDHVLMFPLLC